jgi:hypothetical protein
MYTETAGPGPCTPMIEADDEVRARVLLSLPPGNCTAES